MAGRQRTGMGPGIPQGTAVPEEDQERRTASTSRRSEESTGLVLMVLSAALFAVMGMFVGLATGGEGGGAGDSGLPPTELVFLRATFQLAVVVACMAVVRPPPRLQLPTGTGGGAATETEAETEAEAGDSVDISQPQPQPQPKQVPRILLLRPLGDRSGTRRIVLLRGLVGSLGFVCFYSAMAVLPLGDGLALLSLSPVFTVFLAAAFLGEPVRSLHLASAGLSVLGTTLIARPTFLFGRDASWDGNWDGDGGGGGARTAAGVATALLGSCLASGVLVLVRGAGKAGAHTLQLLFSWCVFGVAASLLLGWAQGGFAPPCGGGGGGGGGPWRPVVDRGIRLHVAGVCVFGTAAHFLSNHAGRLAPAGPASVARSTTLLWGYLLEAAVLRQIPRPATGIGALLIVASLGAIAAEKWRDGGRDGATGSGTGGRYEAVLGSEEGRGREGGDGQGRGGGEPATLEMASGSWG